MLKKDLDPEESGECFSAAVASDGSYNVPEGLICGFPLITQKDGTIDIKRDIALSDFGKTKIKISIDELQAIEEAETETTYAFPVDPMTMNMQLTGVLIMWKG